MVKLTAELIEQSAQYTNPLRDRELDLRGTFSMRFSICFEWVGYEMKLDYVYFLTEQLSFLVLPVIYLLSIYAL